MQELFSDIFIPERIIIFQLLKTSESCLSRPSLTSRIDREDEELVTDDQEQARFLPSNLNAELYLKAYPTRHTFPQIQNVIPQILSQQFA